MKYTEAQRALAKQRAKNATESRRKGEQTQANLEWDAIIARLKAMLNSFDTKDKT